jgi:hypothetical protein
MNRPNVALLLGGLVAVALVLGGCGKSSTSTPTGHPAQTTGTSKAQPTNTRSSRTSTSTSTAGVVTGIAGAVTATLHVGTHHPLVDRPWPLHFTVTRAGAPVRAAVSYEYLFAGQVVAHRSHYIFTGHFSDVFLWPSSAVGYPLTFRAVIVSDGATVNLDYPVQVTG